MKWWRSAVVLLTGLALLILCLIIATGWFIAPQDKLRHADVIVVVSGGDTDQRTDEGVTLWKQNYAPKIAFSGAAADQGISNAAVMRNRAVREGVPFDATIVEEQSGTTRENAEYLKPILEAQNMKTAILVSSPYHTRRVKTTFKKIFGPTYTFIAHPAKDTLWARSSWWKQPSTIQLTWDELRKTTYVTFWQ